MILFGQVKNKPFKYYSLILQNTKEKMSDEMQNVISIILQVLDNASVKDDFTDDEIKNQMLWKTY